ncbi:hypothetical protein HMSP1_75 [Sinorhizobium phage HMSP1-Susan]|nr:hypothetical protein HMSP1_75 [Sinorhizobium phage HMSP1-Susan]
MADDIIRERIIHWLTRAAKYRMNGNRDMYRYALETAKMYREAR